MHYCVLYCSAMHHCAQLFGVVPDFALYCDVVNYCALYCGVVHHCAIILWSNTLLCSVLWFNALRSSVLCCTALLCPLPWCSWLLCSVLWWSALLSSVPVFLKVTATRSSLPPCLGLGRCGWCHSGRYFTFQRIGPLADSFIESRCPSIYIFISPFSCNFFSSENWCGASLAWSPKNRGGVPKWTRHPA